MEVTEITLSLKRHMNRHLSNPIWKKESVPFSLRRVQCQTSTDHSVLQPSVDSWQYYLFLTDKKTRPMMVALYFLIIRQHIMPLVVQILSWDIRHLVDSNLVVMVNTMARIMMMATMVITRKMIWLIMHSIDILIIHQRRHINHNNKIIMEPKWFNIPLGGATENCSSSSEVEIFFS